MASYAALAQYGLDVLLEINRQERHRSEQAEPNHPHTSILGKFSVAGEGRNAGEARGSERSGTPSPSRDREGAVFEVFHSVRLLRCGPAVMVLGTVGGLMPAALAHVIGHSPALRRIEAPIIVVPLTILFFTPAIHDRLSEGNVHPVSLWVAIGLFAWANVRAVVIGPSTAWREFTDWLIARASRQSVRTLLLIWPVGIMKFAARNKADLELGTLGGGV